MTVSTPGMTRVTPALVTLMTGTPTHRRDHRAVAADAIQVPVVIKFDAEMTPAAMNLFREAFREAWLAAWREGYGQGRDDEAAGLPLRDAPADPLAGDQP
jgi:hypothetical protein